MHRVAYFNGKIIPESEVKISMWDAGFQLGYTIVEAERTFNHKIAKLDEHIDRLWKSAKYAQIDPGMSKSEIKKETLRVLNKNLKLISPHMDYWVYQFITGGVFNFFQSSELESRPQTVIISCFPITFNHYARFYKTGAHAVTPSICISPPISQDPKLKCRSRVNYHMADLQARQSDPDAYCLMLDIQGNIAENRGANFFIVTDGKLRTPTTRNVLAGISRKNVIEMAKKLKIPVAEEDLQLYDAYTADEAFFTSTSFCILPISKIDHVTISNQIPGPITQKLLNAWSKKVNLNIVGQAFKNANLKE
jgi:branched-chain amino acid aminotransferase